MRYIIGLCVIALAVAMIAAGLFTWRAEAQDCTRLETVIADIEKHGGYMVDLIDVKGDHVNQLAIFVAKGSERDALIIGGVRNGCMVGGPIAVDTVEPVTPA
jgi:hypothetical protein